jgi:hypothetical protein
MGSQELKVSVSHCFSAKGARLELFFKRSKQLDCAPERRKEKAEMLSTMLSPLNNKLAD